MEYKTFNSKDKQNVLLEGIGKTSQVKVDGKPLRPEASQQVWNHSPTGFSWGYHGSGPAQLALAILLLFTDQRNAVRLHQDFKRDIVASWPCGKDFLMSINVGQWIEKNG